MKIIEEVKKKTKRKPSREDLERRIKYLEEQLALQVARARNLDFMLNDYKNRAEWAETRLQLMKGAVDSVMSTLHGAKERDKREASGK